jgi:nucleoside-diphosphate-sugar epimerase
MNVFVTGAAGYIGGAVARALAEAGLAVQAGMRRPVALAAGLVPVVTGDLAVAAPDLSGVAAVVHAAGLGHRRGVDETVWRAANVAAPVNLALAAKAAGVARFVLVSTAHVHGRVHEGVVSDATPVAPMDAYAASKLEAEARVAEIFGAGLTVLRPVAVIGPHCPGNLQLVMKLLARRMPLPFGAIANRRSFIDVADLAALVLAILRAQTPPPVILAASPDSISTPELISALARGMGRRPVLLPFPPVLLGWAAAATSRSAMWQSLAGSFVADPAAAGSLGWNPAETLETSLVRTGAAYTVP